MSVVGRLWRRAPAWRFCLVSALGCTALAAMFPPGLPHWPARPPVAGAAAHYEPGVAAPDAATNYGLVHTLAAAPPRQGSIRFAGRVLPLPAGSWHEVTLESDGGAEPLQVESLDRVGAAAGSGGGPTLTGLIVVSAPGPLSHAVGPVELPLPCRAVGPDLGQITPTLPSQSPLTHECWVLAPLDTAQVRKGAGSGSFLGLALSRLAERQVAVPARMLALDYMRTDDTGWMATTILLPGGSGRLKSVAAWAARFAPLLHRGYDRALPPGDLTAAAVDDPR